MRWLAPESLRPTTPRPRLQRLGALAFAVAAISACAQDFDAFQLVADGSAGAEGASITQAGPDGGAVTGEGGAVTDSSAIDGALITDATTPDAAPGDASTPDSSVPVDASADARLPACTESGAVLALGHCYFGLAANQSWDAAKASCEAAGAHLVTITSAAEQTVAAGFASGKERWIALRRPNGSAANDASYTWSTGEARGGFSSWASNEPNGSGECVRLTNGGSWGDTSCNGGGGGRSGLCERD
ncbi:MAG: C-type lectin domain-containing protein [Myxococcales bacterium]|nr:C-type lectin domain-containing protein [Myxococcales bacterium]